MNLSGQQLKKLQEALINAFPTKSSLGQMFAFGLDKNLDAIAGEGSLQDVVFRVIQTAQAEGWIEDLVRAACDENSGNQVLQDIAQELLPNPNLKTSPVSFTKNPLKQINKLQKILILAAIPHALCLDKEIREIEEAIRRATNRDLFEIRIITATGLQDICRAIAEERPQIVHFCGHGLEDGSLVLEDDGGKNKPVSPQGLAQLFKLHADYVNCVLLNACHSAKSAETIGQYIHYAIGMNQEIKDKPAIAFAQGFYDALGYDDIDIFQRAFDEGLVAIQLENLSKGQMPVLIKNKTLGKSPSAMNSQVIPSVEVKQELNDVDIETLRELLQLSGRAASERRRALCIEIGINPGELSAIWVLSENDFAVELIDLLHTRKLNTTIYQLCQELKSDFRGGGYASKLAAISDKLNNNLNLELNHSIPISQPTREPSNELTQPLLEKMVPKTTLPERSERIHLSWLRVSNLKTVLVASLTVTVALVGLRFFSVLEWLELKTFDHLLQFRPDEGIDKRLLIIKITDDDILAQDKRDEKGQGSLRDPSLDRLLQILEQHKARLIGLDLYRPFSADLNVPSLVKRLGQKNIIAVCKVPTIDKQGNLQKGVAQPKEVSPENIGFSDFVEDRDGTVRRHLTHQDLVAGANCRTEQSFSFILARRYLELELGKNSNYQDPLKSGDNLQLGGVVFRKLQPFTGGYQDVDAAGFQVLLNYRATSFGTLTKELTLEDIFNKPLKDEDVRDKIVLIGSDAEQQGPPDQWSTPYGKIAGVTVHAHMISQILSAVLDKRPLLSVWSQGVEILWIWSWSLIGGVLNCYWRSFKPLGIAVICGILVLYVTCLTTLIVASLWIPLIPPALALVGTCFVIYIAPFFRERTSIILRNNTYRQ